MEYQPQYLPKGLQKLTSVSEVLVDVQWSCCNTTYSVCSPDVGTICTSEGGRNHKFIDTENRQVIQISRATKLFSSPSMEVSVFGAPPFKIKLKNHINRTLLILNTHKQVLFKIRRSTNISFSAKSKFEIWNVDPDGERRVLIGRIKIGNWEYNVSFPLNLDVKCKAVFIAASFFLADLIKIQQSD